MKPTSSDLWVHLAEDMDEREAFDALLDPRVRVTTGATPPADAAYRILVAGVPDRELVEASPELRTLIIPWSGVPKRTRALMLEFPRIQVHNLHHNAAQVAELAVALLLAAAKRIVPMDRDLRAGDWRARYVRGADVLLEGKTAVVLGYGAVGRRVARLCRGLGLRVVAIRRDRVTEEEARGPDSVLPTRDMARVLPEADALIVCVPLTDETEGMIGERELALMPSSSILVNVGRGPVVDEAALYEALSTGAIAAAGIDVWYSYPTKESERSRTRPSSCPFESLDNVVMSPHRAGAPNSRETESLRMRALAGMLNAAVRGEELPDRVDLSRGY